MTLTLSITFLVLFILATIYSKKTYKIRQNHTFKRLLYLSSLANIMVYCIWIIGCLLVLMEILLISDVYNITSFPWSLFEVLLIALVIVLLLTSGRIQWSTYHDKDNDKQRLRPILKALFIQMMLVSFTSILLAIKFFIHGS
jgi:peptidoglycan biosynthesis protein MviN/MurJ (putative lipid II flippase)